MTAQPSPEYRQHHDVDAPEVDARAFRQGFRVRARLDQLLADDRITPGEWQAAIEYRDAWGRVFDAGGSTGELGARISGSGDPHARAVATIDDLTRLRTVEVAIGAFAAFARLCVVEDRSWREIARGTPHSHETIRDWMVIAVRRLARAWTGASAARRRARTRQEAAPDQTPHSATPRDTPPCSAFLGPAKRGRKDTP